MILGLINAFNLSFEIPLFGYDLIGIFAFTAAMSCLIMWVFNPLTDIQMAAVHENSLRKTVDTTNFVTGWVIIAFLCFELTVYLVDLDLKLLFSDILYFVPLIAVLIGFLPGCGPQLLVTTSMFVSGQIPMAAQIGNSISNDGDALFPALAISASVAILATLYSAVPAIIVAYLWYYLV